MCRTDPVFELIDIAHVRVSHAQMLSESLTQKYLGRGVLEGSRWYRGTGWLGDTYISEYHEEWPERVMNKGRRR